MTATYDATFRSQHKFVVFSGIIAAGKTMLTDRAAAQLGWVNATEPVKTNPYLPRFYKGLIAADKQEAEQRAAGLLKADEHVPFPEAFSMQVFLLAERFAQHQECVWSRRSVVQDRSIYEDVIFAKMLAASGKMDRLDFDTYRALFDRMTNFLHRPDLIVYLDVRPEVALQRLRARGRECEKGVTLEYLTALRDGYEDWLATSVAGFIPVLRVDWNEHGLAGDGTLDDAHVADIIEKIQAIRPHEVHF